MAVFTPEQTLLHANALFKSRYKEAEFCVAAGSIMQGYGTEFSDLDLVIIYPTIETAFRESFTYLGMPIEAFIHDYETLQSFMDSDFEEGHAIMLHMVATGVAVPKETEYSTRLKAYALAILAAGPPRPDQKTLDDLCYAVSDLIDDLKGTRPPYEKRAILYSLYLKIGELRLRTAGKFLTSGKRLARALKECEALFFDGLESVREHAHKGEVSAQDIHGLTALLDSLGGYLFDGYKRIAPDHKRKNADWITSSHKGTH